MRILREAEGMRDRGHLVIFAIAKGGELIARARALGFTVYELAFQRPFWPICLIQLLKIMRKHQIDVVNTHSSLDSWIGGIAARMARRAIVRTRHLSTPIRAGFNSLFVYGKLADFIVSTCASILPMISKQSGKSLSQCRSIPTGVDPGRIQVEENEAQTFRKERGIQSDDFLVGTACFMRSWKGIDDFLKAADLLRNIPKFKWIIIGSGHAERHQKFARELNLENVIFTGHLDRPFPALASLDLFALLSTANEGVSQALLQAAYLRRPLLSTRTGGLAEVCIEQITGLNVPPFAPHEVAKAVLSMRDHREKRLQFGENARQLVLDKFTFIHTLNQMEEVYRIVASSNNRDSS